MEHPVELPAHLRQFVVQQNYAQYTSEDQAVWRFVLLHTYARHLRSAHAAYADGFAAAGITVERIPRLSEMNERLSASGFQALCVDGFIPPRAFQAFQARGFLPIAADIRTSRHLTYTPAPDIIHEAAGHAPFLAQPDYAHFLRRIGTVGEQAFTDDHDRAVHDAIYLLSELKEDPHSTPDQIARAEAKLARLASTAREPSEAARLARLYWWTVEYGLVGTVDDYRLYGAGLLSSIGEAHFCHDPDVVKLPLDAACVDFAYDITRPQPQLFVARDFEQLDHVLDVVANTLAHRIGGEAALLRAAASGELASVELPSGASLSGVVRTLHKTGDAIDWIELSGSCAVACDRVALPSWPRTDGYVLPLGRLADGTSLSKISASQFSHRRLRLQLQNGITISGQVLDQVSRDGCAAIVLVADCVIEQAGRVLLRAAAPYPLILADRVTTAHAQLPLGYHPPSEFTDTQVPKSRDFSAKQRGLIALYDQALEVLGHNFGGDAVARFEVIHAALQKHYPEEWLLRWNLFESLVKLQSRPPLAATLQSELETLELRFAHREPIATGLEYLRALGGASGQERGPR
jgi:phenylalanine-4-hydroxylase